MVIKGISVNENNFVFINWQKPISGALQLTTVVTTTKITVV